jgi:hypothetical protein
VAAETRLQAIRALFQQRGRAGAHPYRTCRTLVRTVMVKTVPQIRTSRSSSLPYDTKKPARVATFSHPDRTML